MGCWKNFPCRFAVLVTASHQFSSRVLLPSAPCHLHVIMWFCSFQAVTLLFCVRCCLVISFIHFLIPAFSTSSGSSFLVLYCYIGTYWSSCGSAGFEFLCTMWEPVYLCMRVWVKTRNFLWHWALSWGKGGRLHCRALALCAVVYCEGQYQLVMRALLRVSGVSGSFPSMGSLQGLGSFGFTLGSQNKRVLKLEKYQRLYNCWRFHVILNSSRFLPDSVFCTGLMSGREHDRSLNGCWSV